MNGIDGLLRLNHPQSSHFYDLGRMYDFLAALGNPQDHLPAIHIAGTNGKGSTAAHLESIYRAAGYKTGLYTSPHLTTLRERIQINRHLITPLDLNDYASRCLAIINKGLVKEKPTFFEVMTAIAFLYFIDNQVEVAIIETGLGGRLDATNTLKAPLASVITSISYDHEAILGHTLKAIAFEKAGIIKHNVPVFVGRLPQEAMGVVSDRVNYFNNQWVKVSDIFGESLESYPFSSLLGDYQRINAGLAKCVAIGLQSRLPLAINDIDSSLLKTEWPGRLQNIDYKGVSFLLDAAHNEAGVSALVNYIKTIVNHGRCIDIVLGATSDQRAAILLAQLTPYARRLFLVRAGYQKSLTTNVLKQYIPEDWSGEVIETTTDALCTQHFYGEQSIWPTEVNSRRFVLITGSVYLVGEILSLFKTGTKGEFLLQDIY